MALSNPRARLLLHVYRWHLAALAVVVAVGGVFLLWLVLYRGQAKVAFTDWPSMGGAGSQGKKPSPSRSSDLRKKDADAGPIAPPMAIPPKSDLGGATSMPVLPGSPEAEPAITAEGATRGQALHTPWPGEGQRFRAQHKKGFGGCWGELLLGSDRLVFTCADDPRKNVVLPLGQITGLDDDGVSVSGEKYHFGIPSVAGKKQVHELFGEWISRARMTR